MEQDFIQIQTDGFSSIKFNAFIQEKIKYSLW